MNVGAGQRVSTRTLLITAALLVAAVAFLPWPLAQRIADSPWSGPGDLAHGVADAFVIDHRHGTTPTAADAALRPSTEFWRWFHLVKAVVAVPLVVVAGVLVPRLRARGAGSRMRRIGRATASGTAACVTLVGVVIVIANVQGAFAPLSSVLSFLPQVSGTEVAVAARAVRLDVSAASLAPSTSALVHDFAVYHAVLAVAATCLVIGCLVMAARLWRSRHRCDPAATGFVAVAFAVIAAANLSTAFAPAPAFAAFLGGMG